MVQLPDELQSKIISYLVPRYHRLPELKMHCAFRTAADQILPFWDDEEDYLRNIKYLKKHRVKAADGYVRVKWKVYKKVHWRKLILQNHQAMHSALLRGIPSQHLRVKYQIFN